MADGFYKQIQKILKKNGFRYVRNAKGSHELWQHRDSGLETIVPYNLHSRHTANGILKDIGVNERV